MYANFGMQWRRATTIIFEKSYDSACLVFLKVAFRFESHSGNSDSICSRFSLAQGDIVTSSDSQDSFTRVLPFSFATWFQVSPWHILYPLYWCLDSVCLFTWALVGPEWCHGCDRVRIGQHSKRKESASHPTLPFLVKGKCRKFRFRVACDLSKSSLASH